MSTNAKYILPISGITSKNKTEVGVTTLELAELMSANVPIPPGFVITQVALEAFAHASQLDQKVKQLQQMGSFSESTLTKLILESDVPKEIFDSLTKEYTNLAGISQVWMRIRAGLYDYEGVPITFIDDSEINEVKGLDALELEIKKVWAKLLIIDQKYDSLGSFIIVQKLIPAEVSGILYTQDLQSENNKHIVVKCMFGEYKDELKNVSDTYVFSKEQEKIIDRSIASQNQMFVRSNKNDFGYEEVEISSKWQLKQKLSDKHIEDLGYLGDYLENVFMKPQEVSWIFQAGKIWINYVKPMDLFKAEDEVQHEQEIEADIQKAEEIVEQEAAKLEKDSIDIELPDAPENIETSEQIEMSSEIPTSDSLSQDKEDTGAIAVAKTEVEPIAISIPEISHPVAPVADIEVKLRASAVTKEVLVVGVGNNKGVIQGKVVLNREEATDQDILVLPEWDEMPKTAAAIIIEDMIGVRSELPVIYGAELASKILREGEYIQLDTDTGFVFEMQETVKQELPPVIPEPVIVVDEPKVEKIPENIEKPIAHKKRTPKKTTEEAAHTEENLDEIENTPTAIKILLHQKTSYKPEFKNNDGYILDLPHSEEIFGQKDNINFNTFKSMIRDFVLPYAESTKNPIFYSVCDTNPAFYIKNSDLLEVQCEAVQKLRSKDSLRNIHIALPKFKNLKQLRSFRKSLTASGLRRSSTLKIYIRLSYASNVFELPHYLEDRYDGVIVSVNALHNSLYSSSKKIIKIGNTLVKALTHIQKDCKEAKVPMLLDLRGIKITADVLKKLESFVYFGVSVIPKYKIETKKFVIGLEKDRIFSKKHS